MSSENSVVVPDLGDFKSVDVVEVLVSVGDVIAVDSPLATLETEKATMDVPSTVAGRVTAVRIAKGDKVSTGSVVVTVATEPSTRQEAEAGVAPTVATVDTGSARPLVVEVIVPDLGDFKSVDVVEVLATVGDTVAVDTPLATLETEKATMDVPSTAAGRVVEVLLRRGDKVAAGTPVVRLEVTSVAVSPPPVAATQARPVAAQPAPLVSPPVPESRPTQAIGPRDRVPQTVAMPIEDIGFSRAYAGPSVRLLARELGVDLARVQGSGPKGRITHADVKSWVKQSLAAAPAVGTGSWPKVPTVDHAKFGPVEVQPLSRIQKISGPRLHASWVSIPHVTQYDEADITELEATRSALKTSTQAKGIKLTPLAFVIRACVQVLKKHPRFNASLDDENQNLILKHYVHVGFAADTPNGLVVPVLRDADRKDVYEIAADLATLSEKARLGKLSAADMQGGCFTVSSLGGIGGTAFTPIINAPEVAILGVSKSSMKPVWNGAAFMPRLMLPLSLSYDHRVIDGASAARFITDLCKALENIPALIEAVP